MSFALSEKVEMQHTIEQCIRMRFQKLMVHRNFEQDTGCFDRLQDEKSELRKSS